MNGMDYSTVSSLRKPSYRAKDTRPASVVFSDSDADFITFQSLPDIDISGKDLLWAASSD